MAGVEGRVSIITGASRGIGRATAEILATRGAKVMCVSRSDKDLAEIGLEYTAADLGTVEGCTQAIAATEEKIGTGPYRRTGHRQQRAPRFALTEAAATEGRGQLHFGVEHKCAHSLAGRPN